MRLHFVPIFSNKNIDWILFFSTLPLIEAGLLTMNSFADANYFFSRQLIWVFIALNIFFLCSFIDWRFLRSGWLLVSVFFIACLVLLMLFLVEATKGAQSWLNLGGFSVQPVDFVKLLLIIILAKYFSRRHVEISHFRHIFVSGLYTLIPFFLVLFQPDFGSAVVIFLIWLGMIVISGVSKKHLFAVFAVGLIASSILWASVLKPYQKTRILSFLNPLQDIHGAGYNAFQSQIAVGSGQMFGKGVGYGTQSRLKFLPEYQTDFVFAAFAEEWGFVGVLIFFALFGIIISRIISSGYIGVTNFEMLFAMGLAIFFMSHFMINVGMNIGLLPVTGIPLPFMSYGGSHLLTEFMGLGMLMGMRGYSRASRQDDARTEFEGIGA